MADLEQDNYTPDKQIALSFPHITDLARVFTASMDNNPDLSYFYLNIRPEHFEKIKTLPASFTLLWDNSNSARNRDIDKELEVLDAYIKKIGKLKIELVPFNIACEKAETFVISNGDWSTLKSVLKKMIYDGGTCFGNIDFKRFTGDEILLFSDGISDFGNSEPAFSSIPVYTINSSLVASHEALTSIAQRSGGVYINLNKNTTGSSVELLSNNNYHFISVVTENGEVSDIYPSMPCQFINSFSMAGVMSGRSATLVLNFGFGSTVVHSSEFNWSRTVQPSRKW